MDDNQRRTIVIVGGVAGGASAAARARRCNEHARIIVYEKDADVSFANCGMPYHIGGDIESRDKLLVATPRLFEKRFNIEARVHEEVLKIDRSSQAVKVRHTQTGELHEQKYDRLILATGASPIVPPMVGADASNVFTLRNLEDMDRIKSFLDSQKPRQAVVIGAGFIGLEMVEQLKNLGIDVALVELMDQVLPPLDPEMAHVVEEELERRGVKLHLGDGIKGFCVEGKTVTGVELQSGAVLKVGLAVLGMGVRPNTKLAVDAELEIGATGGITVNPFMQTSDPHVYAVGDAVEYMHGVLNEPMRVPLAGPANRAGRVAGEHAALDSAAAMAPVFGTAIVRVFDRVAAMTGLSVKQAQKLGRVVRAVFVVAKHHAGYYPGGETMFLKLIYELKAGTIVGAQAVGGQGVDKRIDVIATAMRFGATVRDLAGVDLAYAPPFGAAKDPVHMAGFAACNDLDGITRFAQANEDLTGHQIVDVRNADEVSRFRLPRAINIPLDELRSRLSELDPKRPTVTVCHSGQRAHVAACTLRQHGFEDVKNLTGGMVIRQHTRPDEVVRGTGS